MLNNENTRWSTLHTLIVQTVLHIIAQGYYRYAMTHSSLQKNSLYVYLRYKIRANSCKALHIVLSAKHTLHLYSNT